MNGNLIIKNAADKADMIVEFKPKKRSSVGSKNVNLILIKIVRLKDVKNIVNVEIFTEHYKELKQKQNLIVSSRDYK